MTKLYIRDVVREKDSNDLVSVTIDVDLYCVTVIDKIFNAINRIEELHGQKISDDYLLKSNFFDAIGMIKRMPKNIHFGGDKNERL